MTVRDSVIFLKRRMLGVICEVPRTATTSDDGKTDSSNPIERLSDRPNFLSLAYTWLNAMQPNDKGLITYCSVLRTMPASDCLEWQEKYTPVLHVTPRMPSTFLATNDDALVPVQGSVDLSPCSKWEFGRNALISSRRAWQRGRQGRPCTRYVACVSRIVAAKSALAHTRPCDRWCYRAQINRQIAISNEPIVVSSACKAGVLVLAVPLARCTECNIMGTNQIFRGFVSCLECGMLSGKCNRRGILMHAQKRFMSAD